MNSADRIGQLSALRLKTQMESKNLPSEKIAKIPENDMHGMGEEIPKAETYNKYGNAARGIGIVDIKNMGAFFANSFFGYTWMRILNWR